MTIAVGDCMVKIINIDRDYGNIKKYVILFVYTIIFKTKIM